MDGKGEAVVGMILKLIGTNTSKVITDVKERMAKLNSVLPPGIKVVPYYDQATLIAKCVKTVTKALYEAVFLIIIIQFIMLGGFRPSVIVLSAIPFSLAFAFLLMKYFGISANLMSLGGLAIALGLLVDGAVVMVENIERMLHNGDPDEPLVHVVARACTEVARPIVFSLLIIVIVFLPLFSLQGVEGKTFRPLAQSMSFAMFGSLIFALLLVPVLAVFLLKKRRGSLTGHKETYLIKHLTALYRPTVSFFIQKPRYAIALASVLLIIGGILFTRLGSEFVPKLNEGDLLVRATMAPSISLGEAGETMLRFERRLMVKFPEVTRVVTRVGRGEVGAHADPVNSAESFVALKPQKEWKSARTPDELYEKMSDAFESFPGVQFNFTQPIAAAVDELLTGTKAELAIKIFGPDMDVLKDLAAKVEETVKKIRGAVDMQKDQVSGTPQLRISIDRQAIARYGINVEDVQKIIGTAVGGEKAGQMFEGREESDIVVRNVPESRTTKEAISLLLVPAPGGAQVPLDDLVKIEEIVGPRQITRENNQRFITVQCNVRGRDIGSFVTDAQKAIEANVTLPSGYIIDWGGQFELQQEANKRLMLVVPVTLLIVFLLLFSTFKSLKNSFLILSTSHSHSSEAWLVYGLPDKVYRFLRR